MRYTANANSSRCLETECATRAPIRAVMRLAGISTARIGARVAHSVSKHRLELAFAVYLILVSVQFSASLVVA